MDYLKQFQEFGAWESREDIERVLKESGSLARSADSTRQVRENFVQYAQISTALNSMNSIAATVQYNRDCCDALETEFEALYEPV